MYMVQCPIHRNRKVVMHHQAEGRNEIETNRNEINENETKRNETKSTSVSERRKSVTTGRTNERTYSISPIYPYLFLAEVYKSYQKLTLEI
jgi:uncharacterized Zn finger protein (UPF0148 family)